MSDSLNGAERSDGGTSYTSPHLFKSLPENWEGCCGEGFWLWARRRSPSIPAAGCKDRANEAHRQKSRRPEGFLATGRLASLLLSRRSTRDILLRRASPSSLWLENSTLPNFQTGSKITSPARPNNVESARSLRTVRCANRSGAGSRTFAAAFAAASPAQDTLPRGHDACARGI